jgi:hypothetical protein
MRGPSCVPAKPGLIVSQHSGEGKANQYSRARFTTITRPGAGFQAPSIE